MLSAVAYCVIWALPNRIMYNNLILLRIFPKHLELSRMAIICYNPVRGTQREAGATAPHAQQ